MKAYSKLTALLLALIVTAGYFVSCDINDNKDPANLQTDTYTAIVQIKFATNDDKMKAAVDAMSSSSVIDVDHGNIKVHTVTASDDTSVTNDYILVDGMLYHNLSVKVGEYTVSDYEKASFTEENEDKLLSDIGAGAAVDFSDFYAVDASKTGNRGSYICTDPFDELKESLTDMVAARFAQLGASVYIDSVEYQLETLDGRNASSVLTASYVITINGEKHEITMRLYTTYDYDAQVSIVVPENSDKYTEVFYEDIIG